MAYRWSVVGLLPLAIACARPVLHDEADNGTTSGGASSSGSTAASAASDATTSSSDISNAYDFGVVPDMGFPGCPNEWQPPECWASVCDNFFCGEAVSLFEADGCPRVVCETDEDCIDGRYCSPRMMAGSCFDLDPESCSAGGGGQCVCGSNLSCDGDPRAVCLDTVEFPPEAACRALTIECEYVEPWFIDGYAGVVDVMDEMAPEVLSAVLQCQSDYIARFLGECSADPCFVLCQENGESGCANANECGDICLSAESSHTLELAQLLAGDPFACFDCASCPADNPLCGELWNCP